MAYLAQTTDERKQALNQRFTKLYRKRYNPLAAFRIAQLQNLIDTGGADYINGHLVTAPQARALIERFHDSPTEDEARIYAERSIESLLEQLGRERRQERRQPLLRAAG